MFFLNIHIIIRNCVIGYIHTVPKQKKGVCHGQPLKTQTEGILMKRAIIHIFLILYCLFPLLILPSGTGHITGVLLAVIFAAFSDVCARRTVTAALLVLYFPWMLLEADVCLFLPVFMPESSRKRLLPVTVFHFAALFYQRGRLTLPLVLYILFGCLSGILIEYFLEKYQQLELRYRKLRDDSVESSLLLKERNALLLENQEYEIENAMLQERKRIAREIHDNAGHMLSRCILMTGALKAVNQNEELAVPLEQLADTLSETMDTIRNNVHNLHDESVHLQQAVNTLMEQFTFCHISAEYDMGEEIPGKICYVFLAILKEALTNISKHSDATRVNLHMLEHPAMYQLIIQDNGTVATQREICLDEFAQTGTGMGLLNIYERVQSLNGQLRISGENGFRIFVSIPKAGKKRI